MGRTLVVLAAGIGSRYGGLKQIEAVGPNGAIVIEYSVYDAIRAGFDRVVCVIRRDIEKDFRSIVASRFEKQIPVDYVFQDMDDLPSGFSVPADRKKPWGTGHAVLACRQVVKTPFAVINADDFYGRRSYEALGAFLKGVAPESGAYSMVGFTLRNTLSEHGHVARGVCEVDAKGLLTRVVERTNIEKTDAGARFAEGNGWRNLTGDEVVSMNMWGLTPSLFGALQGEFSLFLQKHATDPKAEFFLPTVVDGLVNSGKASVKVLSTPEHWFGVTYPQDKAVVVEGIRALVGQGVYPEKLWG
ncbi:MAG: nucleotidyltransferase [bacterium]|jgi:NDP-sugar pyrophosphorylase family protein